MPVTPIRSSDAYLTPELTRLGFTEVTGDIIPRMVVCSEGMEGSGKTQWALSAPDPIAAVALDANTEVACARATRERGKRIIMLDKFRLPKATERPKDVAKMMDLASKTFDGMQKALEAVIRTASIRTVLLDTGTELYEMVRLAKLGKLEQVRPHKYAEVNAVMRGFLQTLTDREDLNIIITHKVKKEYATRTGSDGKKEDYSTGNYEFAGFADYRFMANVTIKHAFAPIRRVTGTTVSQENLWTTTVVKSSENMAEVSGAVYAGGENEFWNLAVDIWKGVGEGGDPEYWGAE